MQVLALIGDVVGSKAVRKRTVLQRRLEALLRQLSSEPGELASPYTLTLGDEFQAVFRGPERLWRDLLHIQAELHPVRLRFAIGVGPLSTPINSQQALGMDGPAFHRARQAMEEMKRSGRSWQVGAVPAADWAPVNHVLAYLGHQMTSWEANRFRILRARLVDRPMAELAQELKISKVAIHKNIRVAALDDVAAICHDVTAALQRVLR